MNTGPSQAIIIDSDDDMEEAKPSKTQLKGTINETAVRTGEIGRQGLSFGARDAIKVTLAKIDAEVSFATHLKAISADLRRADQICSSPAGTSPDAP